MSETLLTADAVLERIQAVSDQWVREAEICERYGAVASSQVLQSCREEIFSAMFAYLRQQNRIKNALANA